jgi:hypothetical protein
MTRVEGERRDEGVVGLRRASSRGMAVSWSLLLLLLLGCHGAACRVKGGPSTKLELVSHRWIRGKRHFQLPTGSSEEQEPREAWRRETN